MSDQHLTHWKTVGLAATLVIILSIPLYRLNENLSKPEKMFAFEPTAAFVGSQKCKSCHKQEYDKWENSHHRWAMAEANETTVLGDFNRAAFEHHGVTSRFYRKDGKFFVYTPGPGGVMTEFEVTHTFGWFPLQQYLVPFPGGRLQCLPMAWDVKKKTWYHLYPDEALDPEDWLYWTNSGQNWNGMCAECHSTNLRKNYAPDTDTYQTTWSEISVGCEACHGPGSAHVKWAELPEMGRPETENDALVVKTSGLTAREQIDLCAPCHSRRMSLGDNPHKNVDFLDYAIPQLLIEGYYFPDGQILEEVYVYGSFMQSKMYARDVRCSDCHDVHNIKRIREGNGLCLQCHRAAVYDTKDHHFHKKKGEEGKPITSETGEVLFEVGSGAECEQCHMPGRHYMGIDYRPDHSFRIPRPDLSMSIEVPNACNRCHADKNIQWSVDTLLKWYGQRRRPHYGTIIEAGQQRNPEAISDLVRLTSDRLYPTIVRATALMLLTSFPGKERKEAFEKALYDEEALMRHTAVRNLLEPDPRQRLELVGPLLYDPVKAVRIEAADNMAAVPAEIIPLDLKMKSRAVLAEYRKSMEHTADFAASRHNLGNLYRDLGDHDEAVSQYKKAIAIDREFYPAKVNLAMLYNGMGKNDASEALLREVITSHPHLYEVQYSLGLLLAEQHRYREAAEFLEKAAKGLPYRSRIHYNLGLLRAYLKEEYQAEGSLLKALELEPENRDFLYAAVDFYLKRRRFAEAEPIAERLVASHPAWPMAHQILDLINQRVGASP